MLGVSSTVSPLSGCFTFTATSSSVSSPAQSQAQELSQQALAELGQGPSSSPDEMGAELAGDQSPASPPGHCESSQAGLLKSLRMRKPVFRVM